jgi:hypothetical protein
MAGTHNVNIFSTQTMLDAIEQAQEASNFVADLVFGEREFSDSETVEFDKAVEVETLATYSERGDKGNYILRDSFDTKTFKPPYISEFMKTTAADIINHRQVGAQPFGPRANVAVRAAEQMAKDMAKLRRRVDRRIEQQACGMLETGIITISATQQLNFNLPAGNVYGTGDLSNGTWDNADAEPLTDLDIAGQQIEDTSPYFADICMHGVSAAREFLKHPTVKNNLDTRRIDRGEISPERLGKSVKFLGTVDGIDHYSYGRTYDVAGTPTRYWPAKKSVLFSSQAKAKRHFGAIYNLLAGGLTQIDIFPSSYDSLDGSMKYVKLETSPACAHYELEAVAVLTVLT